jgi:hypothetical protein
MVLLMNEILNVKKKKMIVLIRTPYVETLVGNKPKCSLEIWNVFNRMSADLS